MIAAHLNRILLLSLLNLTTTIFNPSCADDWSVADRNREIAYFTLDAADWLQTRYIATHPDGYGELNPILGRHPSLGKVNMYFAGGSVAQFVVADVLPERWRKPWQILNISVESWCVGKNLSIGIRFQW